MSKGSIYDYSRQPWRLCGARPDGEKVSSLLSLKDAHDCFRICNVIIRGAIFRLLWSALAMGTAFNLTVPPTPWADSVAGTMRSTVTAPMIESLTSIRISLLGRTSLITS